MAYGCVEEDPQAFLGVANKIVAELRKAGLNASWDDTDGHPIVVDGLVWRRRRKAAANKAFHLTGPALRFFETSRSLQPARQVNAVVRRQRLLHDTVHLG